MGSIISKIYDDYDDYVYLCKQRNVEEIDIHDVSWTDHQRKLEKEIDDEVIARKGTRYFLSENAPGPKDWFDRPTEYHFKKQLLEKRPTEIYSPSTIYGVDKPYIFNIEFLDEDENIQFSDYDKTQKMSIEKFRDYLQYRGFKSLFIYEK